MAAFRLWHPLEVWLLKLSGEPLALVRELLHQKFRSFPHFQWIKPVASSVNGTRKPAQKLPPEFRKSFKIPEKQDSRPASPPPRGERLPPLNVLLGEQAVRPDERTINQTAGQIEKSLSEFGIPAKGGRLSNWADGHAVCCSTRVYQKGYGRRCPAD